ncbi:MAG: uracil-DNA glycosylase family protein [Bacteroidota bacterium]
MKSLPILLKEIHQCRICEPHLPLGPRPVLSASHSARILIIGQAPGTKVHASGIPWDDASGRRLREWLQLGHEDFYDIQKIAIIPMGFCYPGKGKSGDLPPRKECAPQWHSALLKHMPKLKLTLLIGRYAQNYYLKKSAKKNLTETVRSYPDYLPHFMPLPHPSPLNLRWLRRNDWYEKEVVPVLQSLVQDALKPN